MITQQLLNMTRDLEQWRSITSNVFSDSQMGKVIAYSIYVPLMALRTMEAPLRHINCRNLTLEFADKSTNMSTCLVVSRIRRILQYFCS